MLEKLNTGLTAFEGLQLDRDEETNNIKVVKAFADNCNSGFQKWKEDIDISLHLILYTLIFILNNLQLITQLAHIFIYF